MVKRNGPAPGKLTMEAAHWHALQREGRLDPALQARFTDWLVTSPEHLREYLAVARVASELRDLVRAMPDAQAASGTPEAVASVPAGNVVALPVRRVNLPGAGAGAGTGAATSTGTSTARRQRSRWWPRLAAAAVVLACLGATAHGLWPQTARYVAAHGAPRSFELPDGSVVHLNAESELSMRFTPFRRQLELVRGQASFVVAAGRRPFAVRAAGLDVRDIGTTFDVSLLREQARIDVAEGRVQVASDAAGGRLLADLRAGQSARIGYRDHAVSVRQEEVGAMTAWWQRRIVFRDEPLRDVADRFNRLNRVRLHVEDEAAGALRLTGNLRGDDVGSLRAFLDDQPGLSTRLEGGAIRVGTRAPAAGESSAR